MGSGVRQTGALESHPKCLLAVTWRSILTIPNLSFHMRKLGLVGCSLYPDLERTRLAQFCKRFCMVLVKCQKLQNTALVGAGGGDVLQRTLWAGGLSPSSPPG